MFEAGDWIDIGFEGLGLGGGKTYSISSSPTESDLIITFRKGVSGSKKALEAIRPSDKLFITQYGDEYDFHLNRNRSKVLIAGGVEIAPFRSMLKEMHDARNMNEVTLIYLNQTDGFLFKDELDIWSRSLLNFPIVYVCTKEINRKKREIIIRSLKKS